MQIEAVAAKFHRIDAAPDHLPRDRRAGRDAGAFGKPCVIRLAHGEIGLAGVAGRRRGARRAQKYNRHEYSHPRLRDGSKTLRYDRAMARRFFTLDVFAKTPLEGNPLGVVVDAEGLNDAQMQRIAREFNLSETVFVLPARNPVNTARIRIFTPTMELPFAGHPTVGSAVLLASLRAPELAGARDLTVVLEEEVGDVNCTVRLEKRDASFAYFDLPRLPEKIGAADARTLADALALEEKDVGFDGHTPVVWSAGTPFCFVPVSGLDAIARARPDAQKLTTAAAGGRGLWLYTRETCEPDSAVHARMFSTMMPGLEDPATGGAAAAFAGVAHAFEKPEDGEHALVIEQGYEMGRPSRITLGMSVRDGALIAATIGGHAVRVSEGTLAL